MGSSVLKPGHGRDTQRTTSQVLVVALDLTNEYTSCRNE